VTVAGHDIVEEPLATRASIGYMPESVPLYPELRIREYLRFRAELKGVRRADRADAVLRAMRDARIDDHAEVLIGQLSKGYRPRVGLADALVSRPSVLILDEPTAGLDPNQIREVRDLIRSLRESHTILLSTHIMSEVEATCDRALVLHKGRLVAQGALDELRKLQRSRSARFAVRGDQGVAEKILRKVPGCEKVKHLDEADADDGVRRFEVSWKESVDDPAAAVERAVSALVAADLGVREALPGKATLEEVFAQLTEDEPSAEQASDSDNATEEQP